MSEGKQAGRHALPQKEINALLAQNRDQLARTREQIGNLAHSLKTPLMALQGDMAPDDPGQAMIARMDRQIAWHLKRARSAGGRRVLGQRTALAPVVEDIALVRPTQMTFGPRVWEMIHQEVQSEVDRRALDGVAEQQVLDERSVSLIGGRQLVAMTGSAPISPELKAWVQKFLGLELMEAYGSTEAGTVMVDAPPREYEVTFDGMGFVR